jgi:hypothetical protein
MLKLAKTIQLTGFNCIFSCSSGSLYGQTLFGMLNSYITTKMESNNKQSRCSMEEQQVREALDAHWQASAVGDINAEHAIYDDDAICDYPQSGERILGRRNLQALRSHHPGKPSGFKVKRILGNGNLWITEYAIIYQGQSAYNVSIMEFQSGKVVHETQYFADPFEAPAWRSQWVQQIG